MKIRRLRVRVTRALVSALRRPGDESRAPGCTERIVAAVLAVFNAVDHLDTSGRFCPDLQGSDGSQSGSSLTAMSDRVPDSL